MAIDATVVVKFGEGTSDDSFVVVSLDDTRNLDTAGELKTTFYPGDEVYFWVHMQSGLTITDYRASSGNVVNEGPTTLHDYTSEIQFPDDGETTDLGVIPSGNFRIQWFGREGNVQRDARTLTCISNTPCIGEASCSFNATLFRFVPPNLEEILITEDDSWPVLIVIYVE